MMHKVDLKTDMINRPSPSMKHKASAKDAESKFSAMFVGNMFERVVDTIPGNNSTKIYYSLIVQEVANKLSKNSNIIQNINSKLHVNKHKINAEQ